MAKAKDAFSKEKEILTAASAVMDILSGLDSESRKKVIALVEKKTGTRLVTREKTWKEKGWYSPTEPFGPRNVDC